MMKRVGSIIGLMIILLVGGCNVKKEVNLKEDGTKMTKEEVREEMLQYLQERYDREFICYSMEYESWALKGQEIMKAYPKGEEEEYHFTVYRNHEKDGSVTYEDGYIGLVMKDVYQQRVEEIIGEHILECYIGVSFNVAVFPNAFMPNTSYEEIKEYTNKRVVVSVVIETSLSEEEFKEMEDVLYKELEEEFKICRLVARGYDAEGFAYVREYYTSPYDRYQSRPSKYSLFEVINSWGEVDFDYVYGEE